MNFVLKSVVAFFLISNGAVAAANTEIIERFVKAFNERNVNTMLDLAAQDMRWMSVSGHKYQLKRLVLPNLKKQ